MAGVGKAIKVDQPGNLRFVDEVPDDVRTDETGAAGEEQIHVYGYKFTRLQSRKLARRSWALASRELRSCCISVLQVATSD